MRGLKDKVVVVTGGAGGMGKAICRRFIEEGAKVAIFDLHAEEAAALAKELGEERTHVEALDISDYAAVENAVDRTERKLGAIDVLVNNAGWDRFQMFLDTDATFRERVIAVNLEGPINMHHVVLKRMSQRKSGRVVTVASDAGRVGSSGQAVYSACKGGIIAFTKTLARELARRNVTLNVLCPGPTDTPLFDNFRAASPSIGDALARAIPLRRLGEPDDYAGMIAFLLSEDAGYMTGQTISVSGGLTMV